MSSECLDPHPGRIGPKVNVTSRGLHRPNLPDSGQKPSHTLLGRGGDSSRRSRHPDGIVKGVQQRIFESFDDPRWGMGCFKEFPNHDPGFDFASARVGEQGTPRGAHQMNEPFSLGHRSIG